jgi:hypothetical protein
MTDASNEAKAEPLYIGLLTVDEAIGSHLVNCDQCRAAIRAKPVGLGAQSKHCEIYWQLHILRARHEGKANNIVAHTENGDEARVMGQLESRQMD